MTLHDLASIATIIEAAFIVISVFFIWREVRETGKLTRAANNQSLVELSSPFNMQLIQDREMVELWISGSKNYDRMDDVDKYRYLSLLTWWLNHHENIFYQKSKDLLDDTMYRGWAADLEEFVKEQQLWLHWNERMNHYQPEFSQHIHMLIERFKPGQQAAQDPAAL